jgi:hypothetical protein
MYWYNYIQKKHMAGPYSRREYMAALTIQRFLHRHVAIWQDWDDHDLLDILEEWRDQYLEFE